MTQPPEPPVIVAENPPVSLAYADRARARTAALHARRWYPGPVGAVLSREIEAWCDFGYRVDQRGLVASLIDELMRSEPPVRAK